MKGVAEQDPSYTFCWRLSDRGGHASVFQLTALGSPDVPPLP